MNQCDCSELIIRRIDFQLGVDIVLEFIYSLFLQQNHCKAVSIIVPTEGDPYFA